MWQSQLHSSTGLVTPFPSEASINYPVRGSPEGSSEAYGFKQQCGTHSKGNSSFAPVGGERHSYVQDWGNRYSKMQAEVKVLSLKVNRLKTANSKMGFFFGSVICILIVVIIIIVCRE